MKIVPHPLQNLSKIFTAFFTGLRALIRNVSLNCDNAESGGLVVAFWFSIGVVEKSIIGQKLVLG